MSPYIFVLVMEASSGLYITKGDLDSTGGKEKLTHICFADDLFYLKCWGRVSSQPLSPSRQ